MSDFDLDAFVHGNLELLGEGTLKNYFYRRNRVDLPSLTRLEDVGLIPEQVLGQADYVRYHTSATSNVRMGRVDSITGLVV